MTLQMVAIRSTASTILTIGFILRMRSSGEDVSYYGQRRNRLKLLSRGVCAGTAMCLYYLSLQKLPLGDAVTIFFTNVVVTATASVLAGYERASWLMMLGCSACVSMSPAHFCGSVMCFLSMHPCC